MKSAVAFALLAATTVACSNVGNIYVAPGYNAQDASAVKRIVVGGWSAEAASAPVLARVAGDQVKLRKEYLVVETMALPRGFADGCKENIQGVLAVRALESRVLEKKVALKVAVELYRCSDGALLWRAEADDEVNPADDNLKSMVENYTNEFGEAAKTYAAPAFVVLQDLLNALPNVTLTEQEIEEKIEIGGVCDPVTNPV